VRQGSTWTRHGFFPRLRGRSVVEEEQSLVEGPLGEAAVSYGIGRSLTARQPCPRQPGGYPRQVVAQRAGYPRRVPRPPRGSITAAYPGGGPLFIRRGLAFCGFGHGSQAVTLPGWFASRCRGRAPSCDSMRRDVMGLVLLPRGGSCGGTKKTAFAHVCQHLFHEQSYDNW
jgi:hypothetical protein